MNVLKIKGRLTGGAGVGTPAALGERELAYNEDGHMAADNEADAGANALFVGGAGDAVKVLVSNRRQVELTGKQNNIAGRKSFRTLAFGGLAGDGTDDIQLPTKGAASVGQILKVNAAGTAMEWGNIAGITTVHMDISDAGGSLEADIDAMDFTAQGGSPTHTPTNTELLVLSYKGSAYLWTGPAGQSIGTGGAHKAVAADTTSLGSATPFANDAAVKAGTAAAAAVAPDTLKSNYLRRSQTAGAADVPQVMDNTMTMNAKLSMKDDINMADKYIVGTSDAARFSMNFAQLNVGHALKLLGATVGVIEGDGTTANQIDACVLDCGTF